MARRRVHTPHREPGASEAYPPELRSRCEPFWSDLDRVVARFAEYVERWERDSFIYRARPSALYHRILSRWAVANGFESPTNPNTPDWSALRAAGVTD